MKHGVEINGRKILFSVWAPERESMLLHILTPHESVLKMRKDPYGYFSIETDAAQDGSLYYYKPDRGKDTPDPASHYQPDGVHGPSRVTDHSKFIWNDKDWRGMPLADYIIYEIHTGTFTSEGSFDGIIPLLDELAATGINAIEIMPVNQFPGSRNWGYDGVYPYAVQNTYGGPDGFKRLIDACHSRRIAVLLDVVYNHIGPEGNYFTDFGPYFTDTYKVPWGNAINLDGMWSDGVREYFSNNIIHWIRNYHLDGLRVDAIHTMFDFGAISFWEYVSSKLEVAEQENGRKLYLIAESDSNDPTVTKPVSSGGSGFDAQWLDDFHHALYVLLHPEGKSSYEDFGQIEQVAKALKDGFVHSGEFVKFRKRKHGASSTGIPGSRFIAFNQNHDQIGNRVKGERLATLVDVSRVKLASAILFMSPYIPMMFMGEEYGEDNPFFYFVSHSDRELIKAVREGRKKEFENYKWKEEPPDPQDEKTFTDSKPNREKRLSGNYKSILEWNKKLLDLRKTNSVFKNTMKDGLTVYVDAAPALMLLRRSEDERQHVLCLFNFSDTLVQFKAPADINELSLVLDSGMEVEPGQETISGGSKMSIEAWGAKIFCDKSNIKA